MAPCDRAGCLTIFSSFNDVQVPGCEKLVQLSASMATSAAVDMHGQLLMWGTDTMSCGVLPDRQEPVEGAFEFSAQYREPTVVKAPPLSQVSNGFAAGAGVTTHGRLATWGWSGYANEVCAEQPAACRLLLSGIDEET